MSLANTGSIATSEPFGGFLDRLPKGLYVLAHLAFIAGAAYLLTQAQSPVIRTALGLYIASQPGFLAYFAGWITMKAAVLAEQTLVFTMVALIVLAR